MTNDIFLEISLLIVLATFVAMIMKALRQPLIIGHILTGIIVGPALLNLINDGNTIEILGKFGIALLLFIVGLGLNPKVIKELGRVAIMTGVGQVLFTTAVGIVITRLLGYPLRTAIYISIGLAFSSTIIIVKLLSDKKEESQLHGRIAIGFLLVQDIIATFALVIVGASSKGGVTPGSIALLAAKVVGLIIVLFIVSQFVIRPMRIFLARSQELLFLFALAWGLGAGALFMKLGFSLEVGALFAGVALASMPYAQDISSRLRPLRDFFIVVFFISLGASLEITSLGSILWQAILLSVFVLVGNPLIVMTLMGVLGYKKKTSFKTSLAVAQISEFSLIFVLLGRNIGDVSAEALSLITVVALITMAISSYMIIYSDKLYSLLARPLGIFERKNTKKESDARHTYDAIIFGYKKGGVEFAKSLTKLKKRVLIVDYDPDVIDAMEREQYDYIYGDATSLELLEEIVLSNSKSIISTITNNETTEFIVRNSIKENPKAIVICSADTAIDAARLYELGATYVMMPHTIGTEKISNFISRHGFKKGEFKHFRDKHLLNLASIINELPEKHHKKLGRAVVDKISELSELTKNN